METGQLEVIGKELKGAITTDAHSPSIAFCVSSNYCAYLTKVLPKKRQVFCMTNGQLNHSILFQDKIFNLFIKFVAAYKKAIKESRYDTAIHVKTIEFN